MDLCPRGSNIDKTGIVLIRSHRGRVINAKRLLVIISDRLCVPHRKDRSVPRQSVDQIVAALYKLQDEFSVQGLIIYSRKVQICIDDGYPLCRADVNITV